MFKPAENMDNIRNNPHLKTERLSSIVERKSEFTECFARLKDMIGEEDFVKYIEPIHNLSKNDNTLLITAGNELQRMHIQDLTPALKQVFKVKVVKVIGIMKTMF